MFDFVKLMFDGGIDIKPYVVLNSITEDEYKTITEIDYTS